jgi:hypothetical protein
MKPVPWQISSLFMRHASLCGFSVRGCEEVPDNYPRSADSAQLFVGDVDVSSPVTEQQYKELFQEVVSALAELLAEEPDAAEALRGRTFARVLH